MSESIADTTRTISARAQLRSGTAARLAGLPVTTLRVWERRYAVVGAPKTGTGQRLYSMQDVQRLGLLKQLTDSGHAIGQLASLDMAALQALAAGPLPTAAPTSRLVVIGRSLARKLRSAAAPPPMAVHDSLEQAAALAAAGNSADMAVDVLLVHLPSLQPGAAERVLALGARLEAGLIVVVYAFAAEPLLASLRAAGAQLLREPVAGRQLSRLVAGAASAPPASRAAWPVAPRRFSDDELAAIAEQPSTVTCECPRHVAEIVMQLGSFERYSAECASRTPEDAALHRQLSDLAAQSRAMFERALERIAAAEGMLLPGAATVGAA